MKTTTLIFLLFVASSFGFGQTSVAYTTSTAAVTSSSTVLPVTSATGFTANSTMVYVDREAMNVLAVSSTNITVSRGQHGTKSAPHASGALIFVGPFNNFYQNDVAGQCTSSNEVALPHINVLSGQIFNCWNSEWTRADWADVNIPTHMRFCTVPVGSVAYSSFGNATTYVNGTMYWSELMVPQTKLLTGISILNAGTVATDKVIVVLYSPDGGSAVANSAVAGTITANANAFTDYAFVNKTLVFPGRYFVGLQANTGTDNFRAIAASTFPDVVTKSATGTFATLNSLTVPTTFTSNVGPIACAY